MKRAAGFRFALLLVFIALGAAFILNDAQGQFRGGPRGSGMVGPRPHNPGMAPANNPIFNRPAPQPPRITIDQVWTCSRCLREVGRNVPAPPARCPHCGARLLNGVGGDPIPSAVTASNPGASSGGWRSGVVIALIIGIVVVGGSLVAGGAWFIIHTINRNNARPRRRRRRREDYDDRE